MAGTPECVELPDKAFRRARFLMARVNRALARKRTQKICSAHNLLSRDPVLLFQRMENVMTQNNNTNPGQSGQQQQGGGQQTDKQGQQGGQTGGAGQSGQQQGGGGQKGGSQQSGGERETGAGSR
jgi:hypothetical protein